MINKKNLAVITCLIVVGFFWFKTVRTSSKEPIITLTKSGFSPAGLKVKIGTKIKFVNKTPLSFWPASDLHPNHTIYPEFDSKRAVAPKESWEFQFNQTGTFRFHDHLNPINRGTVVVLEEDLIDIPRNIYNTKGLLAFCSKNDDPNKKAVCINGFLEEKMLTKGPDYVFKMVGQLREMDPVFASECHTIAHELGGIGYWKYAKDKKLPKTGSISVCGFGYIHGFMTEFGHHSKDFLQTSGKVCQYFSEKINYKGFEQMLSPFEMCYHGIGHGLAYYYVPDFGEDVVKIIEKGANDCKEFTDKVAISNCQTGLFGGLASVYNGGHGFSLPMDKTDPLAICRVQPEELKGGCYDNMIPAIGLNWPDLQKIISFFTEIEDGYLQRAFDSIGDYASHLLALEKMTSQEVINICSSLGGEMRIGCFYGFSQGIVRNFFPETAPMTALNVCRSKVLTDTQKESCLNGVMIEIKNVLPDYYEKTLNSLVEKERNFVINNDNK